MTKTIKPSVAPLPRGRPKKDATMKRVNIYLDPASIERATKLGAGNVSEGIRIALAK